MRLVRQYPDMWGELGNAERADFAGPLNDHSGSPPATNLSPVSQSEGISHDAAGHETAGSQDEVTGGTA